MIENALNTILRKSISTGTLRVTFPSGRQESYGDGSGTSLAIRFADMAAMRSVMLDPGSPRRSATWRAGSSSSKARSTT